MTKAARTYLEPGSHSIDRVTPRQRDGGTWVIDWSLRLPSGRLIHKRTQATTKSLVRARARRTAEKLLTTGGAATASPSMDMSRFISEVTIPSIQQAGLAPSTTTLYKTACDRLSAAFKGLSVADALTYSHCSEALQGIAAEYGIGAARNAQKALRGHIITPALARSLIATTPLPAEHPVKLSGVAKESRRAPRGSAALTTAAWHQIIDHCLALDPAEGVAPPKRGRWSLEDRIRKRRNSIDQLLLQAATGLRLQEALGQRVGDFEDRGTGGLWLTVSNPKTRDRTRTIPVLHPGVADHLRGRLAEAGHRELLLTSPTDASKPWTASAAKEAMTELYTELAEVLGIEPLQTLRSHAWRTVINRRLIELGVDEPTRTALLGHSEAVNAASYTYGRSLAPVTDMIGQL